VAFDGPFPPQLFYDSMIYIVDIQIQEWGILSLAASRLWHTFTIAGVSAFFTVFKVQSLQILIKAT